MEHSLRIGDDVTVLDITHGKINYIEEDGTVRIIYGKSSPTDGGFCRCLTEPNLIIKKRYFFDKKADFSMKKMTISDRIKLFFNPKKYFIELIK